MPTRKDADPLMQEIMRIARANGMSGFDLSVAADISYSTLSKNAVGTTSPRLIKIRKLLHVIQYDIKLEPIRNVED